MKSRSNWPNMPTSTGQSGTLRVRSEIWGSNTSDHCATFPSLITRPSKREIFPATTKSEEVRLRKPLGPAE
jgi:hypothetical protein